MVKIQFQWQCDLGEGGEAETTGHVRDFWKSQDKSLQISKMQIWKKAEDMFTSQAECSLSEDILCGYTRGARLALNASSWALPSGQNCTSFQIRVPAQKVSGQWLWGSEATLGSAEKPDQSTGPDEVKPSCVFHCLPQSLEGEKTQKPKSSMLTLESLSDLKILRKMISMPSFYLR